jgi:hypothetical protein
LSRMKKVLATVVTSVLLLGMMTAPAFAFIHTTIPAGTCAASGQAGDNEEAAEEAIVLHNKAQGQDLPIGNSQGAEQSQAPCNS